MAVNLDIAAHRMALRQTDSLGVAQLLMVKARVDVEMEELRQAANNPDRPSQAVTERAIETIEQSVEALPAVQHVVDKRV